MITRRDLLRAAVAAPAWVIGSKLGRDSKAKDNLKVSICFTHSDELLDYVAVHSPAAVKVRQDMNDDGSMSWTVLEVRKTKYLCDPKTWDIKREADRFHLAEIERKDGMIHKFWIKKVANPNEFDRHCALLDSVGNDQLLVRKEANKWIVLHREPKSRFESSGGYTFHYANQVFVADTITKDKAGKMKLFMLWRTRPFAIEGVDLGRAEKFTVTQ